MTLNSTSNQSFHVFISYSSSDKQIADAVRQGLANTGIRCWMAPFNITPGKDWAAEVVSAIETCPIMVLVWTHASMRSPEVSKELGLAMTSGSIVIPFRLENVEPQGSFKYHLIGRHWLDVYDRDLEDAIQKLSALVAINIVDDSDSLDGEISLDATSRNTQHDAEKPEDNNEYNSGHAPSHSLTSVNLHETPPETRSPSFQSKHSTNQNEIPQTEENRLVLSERQAKEAALVKNERNTATNIETLVSRIKKIGHGRLHCIDSLTGDSIKWHTCFENIRKTGQDAVKAIAGSNLTETYQILAVRVESQNKDQCEGIAITDTGIGMTIGRHPMLRWRLVKRVDKRLAGKTTFIQWQEIESVSVDDNNVIVINGIYPLCVFWDISRIDKHLVKHLEDLRTGEYAQCDSLTDLADDLELEDEDITREHQIEQEIWLAIIELCLDQIASRSR